MPDYNCIIERMEQLTVDIAACEKGIICSKCKGKGELAGETCEDCRGGGVVGYECGFAEPTDESPQCPYYRAKWNAAHRPVAVMTLAYMFLASTAEEDPINTTWRLVKGRFPPRDLLIVDEAHGAADFAANFISLTLSKNTLRGVEAWKATWKELSPQALKVRNEEEASDFIRYSLVEELHKDIRVLEEIARNPRQKAKADRDRVRIASLIERAEMALADMQRGNPWAIDPRKKEKKLVLQPVLIGPFLKRRLWNRAGRYLMSTATVLDPNLFLKELGLQDLEPAIMRIPSIFPPERSPVINATAGPLTRKYRQANLPGALKALCGILDKEKGRGLVHCHSYENSAYIKDHLPPRYKHRLTFHESRDRTDVLEAWLEDGKEGSVLVSVAMTEGLDLKDELARWAVIFKVPYPFLGDKRVARRIRLPDGRHWYRLAALRTIIQAAGRIVRSEEDEGRIYILDSAVHTLFRQTARWVPDWFDARLRAGGFT